MKTAADKGFWVKCAECAHLWIAAYYPMDAMAFAKLLLSHKRCPRCGSKNSVVAKQDNGVLLEAMP